MSRTQIFQGVLSKTMVVAGTKYNFGLALGSFYKSCFIQADALNIGVTSIFDGNGNLMIELTAGRSATFLGDNMDNGTAAKFDVSLFQVSSSVGNDVATLSVASGL